MLYLAGIVITFFLALILWTKKGRSVADNILSAWLCTIGVHLLLCYYFMSGSIYDSPHLLGIQIPMPLLHGPFLYIYTVAATTENRLSKKLWFHFLPALGAYALLMPFFFLSGSEKVTVFQNKGAGYELQSGIIFFSVLVSGFVYVALSLYELKKYRKTISEEFSNTERINLNWLRYLIYGILSIWMIVLLKGDDRWIYAAVVIFVALLGFFGIKHVGIFTYRHDIVKETPPGPQTRLYLRQAAPVAAAMAGVTETETEVETEIGSGSHQKTPEKYRNSGLQPETAQKIHAQLKELMDREKLFSEDELSLGQLADRLSVHPNILSQVINTLEKKSFYDYINGLRIAEFQRLAALPENSRYTLLSLAFEVGFNSKTSFNRNFKKTTGLSPSAYLKQMDLRLAAE